jgi:hypothetical protein
MNLKENKSEQPQPSAHAEMDEPPHQGYNSPLQNDAQRDSQLLFLCGQQAQFDHHLLNS